MRAASRLSLRFPCRGLPAVAAMALAGAVQAAPPAERRAELRHMVRHECGACHGLTRQGGLGPALTPGALADRPDKALVRTILEGRGGTAMPPWRRFLTPAEARWLVGRLKEGALHAQ